MKVDQLNVRIFETRKAMGEAAAEDIAGAIRQVLGQKPCCNMIFAAAPSQNEVLEALASSDNIEWERVRAFHMDEYIGLPPEAPQRFANFLKRALFDRVPFRDVYLMDSEAEPAAEAARYAALLAAMPADIVLMGIGENGHIAFNDPHVALFNDPAMVKEVELDEVCRTQQVHDGCFAALDDVPRSALTLTIPALTAPKKVFCVVPAKAKAPAVRAALRGPVAESCPASVLRRHGDAVLYLDKESASLL